MPNGDCWLDLIKIDLSISMNPPAMEKLTANNQQHHQSQRMLIKLQSRSWKMIKNFLSPKQ